MKTTKTRTTLILGGLAGAMALQAASSSLAEDRYWRGRDGFPAFWNNYWSWHYEGDLDDLAPPPGPTDRAIFYQDSGFADVVFEDEGGVALQLLVKAQAFSFIDGEGMETPASLELVGGTPFSPSAIIGAEPGDYADLSLGINVNAASMSVGDVPGAVGSLTVFGTERGPLTSINDILYVAPSGMAFLTVENGGALYAGLLNAAGGLGSFADIIVEGPMSTLTVGGRLTLATGGLAFLAVEDGGLVTTGELLTAPEINGNGEVLVSGEGSLLAVTGDASIGSTGSGEIVIEDGGRAEVGGDFFLSQFAAVTPPFNFVSRPGVLRMNGSGTSLSVDGTMRIGYIGEGYAYIDANARVDVQGDLSMSFLRNEPGGPLATLYFNVGSASVGSDEPTMSVLGGVVIEIDEPKVGVLLADDYDPAIGDTFKLIEAADGVDLITVILDEAPLPEPLDWQVMQTGTELTITVADLPVGDLTQDGAVNADDLFILLGAWGDCPDDGPCPADLDDNGAVNADDLFALLSSWTG